MNERFEVKAIGDKIEISFPPVFFFFLSFEGIVFFFYISEKGIFTHK